MADFGRASDVIIDIGRDPLGDLFGKGCEDGFIGQAEHDEVD